MKIYIAVLALLLTVPTLADDYVKIVEQALANISNDYRQEWAFTESVIEDGVTIVGRYDPSQPSDARWHLISIDGQQPTEEEIADFADDREDRFHDHDDDNDIDIVNFDTLELVEETNDFWVFRFEPEMDDDEDDTAVKFMRQVEGRLQINRHGNFLEYIDIFTPMIGRDGKPREELFSGDGLHLNRVGYELWTKVITPYLELTSDNL